jgi:hypothetical protein
MKAIKDKTVPKIAASPNRQRLPSLKELIKKLVDDELIKEEQLFLETLPEIDEIPSHLPQ